MRKRVRSQRAYTLLEVLISSASGAVLMVGLSTSIYIASQSLNISAGPGVEQLRAEEALSSLMTDVGEAVAFQELTARAVTFTAPDRDGDGKVETIRYAWSGVKGDPLTYQMNGGPTTNFIENVQTFELNHLTRFIEAKQPRGKLLFVSGGEANANDPAQVAPTQQEKARIDLIEAWEFQVRLIGDFQTQADFLTALDGVDAAYVSGEANAAEVGSKLTATTVGVVNELDGLTSELGFSSSGAVQTTDSLVVQTNGHYITWPFEYGRMKVTTTSQPMFAIGGAVSWELSRLATVSYSFGGGGIVVLDKGDNTHQGGNVAGRRVQLPWGDNGFAFSSLNTNGQILMRRAIEWAAEKERSWRETETPDVDQDDLDSTVDSLLQWRTYWQ